LLGTDAFRGLLRRDASLGCAAVSGPHGLDDSSELREESVMSSSEDAFSVGTAVDVRDRFRRSWSRGFEITEAAQGGYRLLRVSDRYPIPMLFHADDVRRSSRGEAA
jgi:hypothetical protein